MAERDSASERLLYHGTSHDVADAICFQNFDFRLSGKNALIYGKGAYFSASAVTVTIIQHLIQKVIPICLLRKF